MPSIGICLNGGSEQINRKNFNIYELNSAASKTYPEVSWCHFYRLLETAGAHAISDQNRNMEQEMYLDSAVEKQNVLLIFNHWNHCRFLIKLIALNKSMSRAVHRSVSW